MDFNDVFAYSASILIVAVIILIIMTIIFLISGSKFIDAIIFSSIISAFTTAFLIVGLISY
jgi:uncharacterized MnhB-related membrane protein